MNADINSSLTQLHFIPIQYPVPNFSPPLGLENQVMLLFMLPLVKNFFYK